MKRLEKKQYIVLFFALLSAVLLWVVLAQLLTFDGKQSTSIQALHFSGTWQSDSNAEPEPFDENTIINTVKYPNVKLEGHFDKPLEAKTQIFFLIKYLEVHIYRNGTEVYQFGQEGSYPLYSKSSGMTWARWQLDSELTPSDEVTIVLKNKYPNNYYNAYTDFIQSFVSGDSGALARIVLVNNGFYIISGVIFFFLSLILLVFSLMLAAQGLKIDRSIYLFICYAISACLWISLDPVYSTLLIANPVLIMELEVVAMLLSTIFLLAYLESFMKTKASRVCRSLIFSTLLFGVIFLLFQITQVTDAYAVRTVLVIFLGCIGAVGIACVIYEICHDPNHHFKFLLIPGIIFIVFAIIELFNYALELFPLGKALFIGFVFIIAAQFYAAMRYIRTATLLAKQAAELEKELTDRRVAIMLSQIQPHFLYNALNGICELCVVEPEKAEEMIIEFSSYLRGNMDALTITGLIPFEKELTHTKHYINIEEMRFEERLKVEYDIREKGFMLPSLTIQPIVENAIRYGVIKKETGGTVTIKVWASDNGYYIKVMDDGIGTAPEADSGIANVRNRVESQCGGSLTINRVKDVGTTVTIEIPKTKM